MIMIIYIVHVHKHNLDNLDIDGVVYGYTHLLNVLNL